MAKTRRYRRRYYRRRRKLGQYFKAKLDMVMRAALDTTGFKFLENNANTRSLENCLAACTDWDNYTGIFHTFKITGIAINVSPGHPVEGDGGVFIDNGTQVLALLTNADTQDFNSAVEANSSIILTLANTQRKYINMNGGETGWISTSDTSNLDGRFICATNNNASAGGCKWDIKFTFYVMFKNPN